jgi:hypothetical protein
MIIKGVVKPFPQYETYTKKDGATDYKQTMLVETYGQYPKLVAMTIMGSEKITDILQKWAVGSAVDVHVNAESREYQGKYYTNLNVWKVESGSQTVAAGQGVNAGVPAQAAPMGGQPMGGGYAPQMGSGSGVPMPVVPQSPFNQPMNGGQPAGSPLQQHVEQLQAQAQQQAAPAAPQYQIGQIVNGYQMQADGSWLPAPQAAPAPAPAPMPAPIQNAPPQQAAPQNGLQGAPGNWDASEIPF